MYISIASLLPVNQSRISLQYHEPMTLLDLYRSWITSADAINLFNAQEKSRKISKSYEMYFFMYLLYKINRFHFSVVCSVIDVQRTSQRDKNISDPLDFVSWATFLFLPRCGVICAWTTNGQRQKGIYLLNRFLSSNCALFLL